MRKRYGFTFALFVLVLLLALPGAALAGGPLGPKRFLIQNDGALAEE